MNRTEVTGGELHACESEHNLCELACKHADSRKAHQAGGEEESPDQVDQAWVISTEGSRPSDNDLQNEGSEADLGVRFAVHSSTMRVTHHPASHESFEKADVIWLFRLHFARFEHHWHVQQSSIITPCKPTASDLSRSKGVHHLGNVSRRGEREKEACSRRIMAKVLS